jgi:hypothetical protein
VNKVKDEWIPLLKLYKKEIDDRASIIDCSNEQNWFSLILGWAIAKGLDPDDAYNFASYIRYKQIWGRRYYDL